jgi:cell division protein FtsW (lipid II flippase)
MSKEVDAKMELNVKILNDNSILTTFFMFAAVVIISLVSFLTLHSQEAKKKTKSSEDHMKLMKSFYIMFLMAVFILVLIIEYTL